MDFKKTLWISHSAINDFNNCSRLYYFKSVYRNPKTGNRVQIVNPYLSLGSAVHNAIDEIVNLSPSKRAKLSLLKRFSKQWNYFSGKKGGFVSLKQESEFKKRGIRMIKRVEKSDILKKKSLKKDSQLPKMTLFKGIELVGSFDWMEILPDNSLHIIDFKTGKKEEAGNSLQLPIYYFLAKNNYDQKVKKMSYWYLEKNTKPTIKRIDKTDNLLSEIKRKAREIEKSIREKSFDCNSRYSKCFWCRGYESVLSGKAEYIGFDQKMRKDQYYLANGNDVIMKIKDGEFLDPIEKKLLKMRLDNMTLDEVREKTKLSKKKIKDLAEKIKKKVKENLSRKELAVFIQELYDNGNKFNT